MQMTNECSQYQLVGIRFMQDNLAASQTDVQLLAAEVNSAAGNAVDGVSAPFSGMILGVSYDLSAAAANGQLTVGASINGTEDANTTQTITTSQKGYGRVKRDLVRFSAGDQIGVEITTNGAWDGLTADLVATVWCLFKMEGV